MNGVTYYPILIELTDYLTFNPVAKLSDSFRIQGTDYPILNPEERLSQS